VRADGTAVTFRSRKHLALLVYLAVEQRHSPSRDTLLGLLWPEADEEAARNNLRVALADLRRGLGEATIPFLHTTRHTVQFDRTSDHTLDVLAFRALLHLGMIAYQQGDHAAARPLLESGLSSCRASAALAGR
jgi:DNA-binding SARP family transcriptional activator